MKLKRKGTTVFLLLICLSFLSCRRGSLEKAGSWEIKPLGAIVEFYYLARNIPEAELKAKIAERAGELLKTTAAVEIYILYDRERAEEMASPRFRDRCAGEEINLEEFALMGSRTRPGGAVLRIKKNDPEYYWRFDGDRKN